MADLRQPDLFSLGPALPEGFDAAEEVIVPGEEQRLLAWVADLPFRPFEFRGYTGHRRVVSFGWRYDFGRRALEEAGAIPPELEAPRRAAALLAGLDPEAFAHALVTEYAPGAPIGWHRDRPEFGDVVGLSLASPCTLRFRRRQGAGWERAAFVARPRSAYLLRGPARTEWEHSIPPVDALRFSITFRTLRSQAGAAGRD